jgi:plastocyanin
MPGPRAARAAAALLAVAAAAGCSHTTVVGTDGTLHLALNEYRLNPARVRASAGVITIYVRNFGRLTHDLVISRDGQAIAGSNPVPPGQNGELYVDLPPGTYSMASRIRSDQALGIYGTLVVTR